MRLALSIASIFLSSVAAGPTFAAPVAGKFKWTVERPAGKVVLKLRSARVEYGAIAEPLMLVLTCTVEGQRLQAHVASVVKTMGTFVVRFDGEPAVEHGSPDDRFPTLDGYDLRVADQSAAAFIQDVRTHGRMLLRHDFLGRFYDATFDLTGLAAVIGPFQQACGLPDVTLAPPASRAAASVPRIPRETRVGNWDVTESVSKLDDKPQIVMIASDKLGKLRLVVRCQEQTLEAYFVIEGTVFDADRATMLVTFKVAVDGAEPSEYRGSTTEHHKAAFFPDAHALVKSLTNRRSVAVTYTPYRQTATKTATIDITDFDKAVAPLLAACPMQ